MQVSVGSPVMPRNCHQCTRLDWGLVTADTSVVHPVCGPEIIFPELSVKNKDQLKWEKASACLPSSSTSFLFALCSHEGAGTRTSCCLQQTITLGEIPSWISLSSPCHLQAHPCVHLHLILGTTALPPFCSEKLTLIAAVNGPVGEGQTGTPKPISVISSLKCLLSHWSVFSTAKWATLKAKK